jgi:hypothetical protein
MGQDRTGLDEMGECKCMCTDCGAGHFQAPRSLRTATVVCKFLGSSTTGRVGCACHCWQRDAMVCLGTCVHHTQGAPTESRARWWQCPLGVDVGREGDTAISRHTRRRRTADGQSQRPIVVLPERRAQRRLWLYSAACHGPGTRRLAHVRRPATGTLITIYYVGEAERVM